MVAEKRLIDIEKVYQRACAGCTRHGETPGECYHDEPCERLLFAFTTAEPVDAAEVVHGRWEKCWQEKSKHYFRCSNCHTAYMDGVSGAIAPEYGSRAWNYCPNCGAKMDLEA